MRNIVMRMDGNGGKANKVSLPQSRQQLHSVCGVRFWGVAAKKDIKSFSHVCRAKKFQSQGEKPDRQGCIYVNLYAFVFCMCASAFVSMCVCQFVLRQIIVIWLTRKLQPLGVVCVSLFDASSHELEKVFRFSWPGTFATHLK